MSPLFFILPVHGLASSTSATLVPPFIPLIYSETLTLILQLLPLSLPHEASGQVSLPLHDHSSSTPFADVHLAGRPNELGPAWSAMWPYDMSGPISVLGQQDMTGLRPINVSG